MNAPLLLCSKPAFVLMLYGLVHSAGRTRQPSAGLRAGFKFEKLPPISALHVYTRR